MEAEATSAENKEAFINSIEDTEIHSVEEGFQRHENGKPEENISNGAKDEKELEPPDTSGTDTYKIWFHGNDFIDDITTNIVVWILENGNVYAFNTIYKNKYKPLKAGEDVQIDEDDKGIITNGLHAIAPKFFAWAKKQSPAALAFIYFEYTIILDMKNAATPLDKTDEDKEEPAPPKKEKPKPKPAEEPARETKKQEPKKQEPPPPPVPPKPPMPPAEPPKPPMPAAAKAKEKKALKIYGLDAHINKVIIGNWLKAEGAPVKEGEAVLEYSTDKIEYNKIYSTANGILIEHLCKRGDFIPVGQPVGVIEI